MTEDVDLAVPESLLQGDESRFRTALEGAGFRQVPGTATWTDEVGHSLDLLAFVEGDSEDRPGGTPGIPAMVFADLNRILQSALGRNDTGCPGHLSVAGLVLAKLLTLRVEKGPKDRLHALLLLAEHEQDEELSPSLSALAATFPADTLEDVLPEAQAAVIALEQQSTLAGDWVRPYAARSGEVRKGFRVLQGIVETWR
jgi:hypothetical protein